jgi:metal-sulfur cluster biosynthetic enzyme
LDEEAMTDTNPAQPVSTDVVYAALQEVYDPEIPVSIVDLGLVYDVKIIDRWVGLKMTLTAPGCGMAQMIANAARERIKRIEGVEDAEVRIVWEPQWNPSMMSEAAKMKLGWKG